MFLQRPAKVFELSELGTGGAYVGEKVPLGGLQAGAISVTSCAHVPEHVCIGHQSFLPCDDGAISAVQLPLLSSELLLQLSDHRL
jgi:hypothetical protein